MKTIPNLISSKGSWVVDGDFEFKELAEPLIERHHVFSFNVIFDKYKEDNVYKDEYCEVMGEKLKQDFIKLLKSEKFIRK